jgi:hypothetical protein
MSKLSMGYLTSTVLVLLFVSARALHIEQSFDQSTFASVGEVTVQEVKRVGIRIICIYRLQCIR